jgi:hypothetical protein
MLFYAAPSVPYASANELNTEVGSSAMSLVVSAIYESRPLITPLTGVNYLNGFSFVASGNIRHSNLAVSHPLSCPFDPHGHCTREHCFIPFGHKVKICFASFIDYTNLLLQVESVKDRTVSCLSGVGFTQVWKSVAEPVLACFSNYLVLDRKLEYKSNIYSLK